MMHNMITSLRKGVSMLALITTSFIILSCPHETRGLSSPSTLLPSFSKATSSSSSLPIRRVAIIGGGIAGLSLGHALENSSSCAKPYLDVCKALPPVATTTTTSETTTTTTSETTSGEYGIETCIFDSRPKLNFEAGAGVQINGGARAIQKINSDLFDAVKEASLPLKKIKSRTKPWFGNKKFATLLELDIKDIIQQTGGTAEEELIVDGQVMAFTIMRGALQVRLPITTCTVQIEKKKKALFTNYTYSV